MHKIEIKDTAFGISVISIIFNLALTVLKLVVGVAGHSYALVSDGIHSVADVLSSAVVAVGIKLNKERATAIAVAVILIITGLTLGYKSIAALAVENYGASTAPSALAFIMAIVPVISKELMYRFELGMSKKFSSDALHADAIHHRTDGFVSLGVLFGVAGGYLGYPSVDMIAGFIVAILILKVAAEILLSVTTHKNRIEADAD